MVALQSKTRSWTVLAWTGLGFYAWASVITGSVLPEITTTFGLSPVLAGLLVSLPAIGFTFAGFAGSQLIHKVGIQPLLTISALSLALSLLLMATSPVYSLLGLAVLMIGLSGGMLETGGNGLITELYPERAGQELNRLHIFFGMGAFLSPMVTATLLSQAVSWRACYALAAIPILILVFFYWSHPSLHSDRQSLSSLQYLQEISKQSGIKRAWLGALIFVAAELGFSNWLSSYLVYEVNFSPGLASLGLSSFWLAMLLGRYVNAHLPARWSDRKLILIESLAGSVTLALVLPLRRPEAIFVGIVLIGLFMAGLLPWLLAYAGRCSPVSRSSISGFILSGVGVGMLIGPGLIGLVYSATTLSTAMSIPVLLLLSLAAIFWKQGDERCGDFPINGG